MIVYSNSIFPLDTHRFKKTNLLPFNVRLFKLLFVTLRLSLIKKKKKKKKDKHGCFWLEVHKCQTTMERA